MITIIIHNSGLELINSKSVSISHNAVTKDSQRRNKKSSEILLDLSVHQAAIKKEHLSHTGRPDIIHQSLLVYHHNMKILKNVSIELIIHTRNDDWFSVPSSWRIPVSYIRFRGVIEQLLIGKELKLEGKEKVYTQKNSLLELIELLNPNSIYNLSLHGNKDNNTSFYEKIQEFSDSEEKLVILIGGYQRGSIIIDLGDRIPFDIRLFETSTPTWNILAHITQYLIIKEKKI